MSSTPSAPLLLPHLLHIILLPIRIPSLLLRLFDFLSHVTTEFFNTILLSLYYFSGEVLDLVFGVILGTCFDIGGFFTVGMRRIRIRSGKRGRGRGRPGRRKRRKKRKKRKMRSVVVGVRPPLIIVDGPDAEDEDSDSCLTPLSGVGIGVGVGTRDTDCDGDYLMPNRTNSLFDVVSDVDAPSAASYLDFMERVQPTDIEEITTEEGREDRMTATATGTNTTKTNTTQNTDSSRSRSRCCVCWGWTTWFAMVLSRCCCVAPFLCLTGCCQILGRRFSSKRGGRSKRKRTKKGKRRRRRRRNRRGAGAGRNRDQRRRNEASLSMANSNTNANANTNPGFRPLFLTDESKRNRELENGPVSQMRMTESFLSLDDAVSDVTATTVGTLGTPRQGKSDAVAGATTRTVEQSMTGLLEDICLAMMQFNDTSGVVFRHAIRFRWIAATRLWFRSLQEFFVTAISVESYDSRPIEDIVRDEGYPYELCHAVTLDGYDLWMHRIPNRRSRKVVFFQHGILDSAFAWVGNRFRSLAFRRFDEGCDVYMGDFRGTGHSQIISDGRNANMWDYTIDELGKYDIRAFIERIVALKREELREPDADIRVDLVAHSMGGGASLAYLVWSRVLGFDHRIRKAVLLAPCGIHRDLAPFFVALRKIPLHLAKFVGIPYVGIRSRTVRILFAKLCIDVLGHRGIRSFVSVLLSGYVLGGSSRRFPFNSLPNVMFHIFQGTSLKVMDHFAQLNASGSFYGYDYGSTEENRKHHGTDTPIHYLDHYGEIDIPVILFAGGADRIIPSSDVKRHYMKLAQLNQHDGVVHKFRLLPRVGHLDLSYSLPEQVLIAIEDILKEGSEERILGDETNPSSSMSFPEMSPSSRSLVPPLPLPLSLNAWHGRIDEELGGDDVESMVEVEVPPPPEVADAWRRARVQRFLGPSSLGDRRREALAHSHLLHEGDFDELDELEDAGTSEGGRDVDHPENHNLRWKNVLTGLQQSSPEDSSPD